MTQSLRNLKLTLARLEKPEPFLAHNTMIQLDEHLLGGVQNLTLEFDACTMVPMAYIDILGPAGDRYRESIDQGFIEVFSGDGIIKLPVTSEELYGWETDSGEGLSWAKLSFPVNLSIKDDYDMQPVEEEQAHELTTVVLRT